MSIRPIVPSLIVPTVPPTYITCPFSTATATPPATNNQHNAMNALTIRPLPFSARANGDANVLPKSRTGLPSDRVSPQRCKLLNALGFGRTTDQKKLCHRGKDSPQVKLGPATVARTLHLAQLSRQGRSTKTWTCGIRRPDLIVFLLALPTSSLRHSKTTPPAPQSPSQTRGTPCSTTRPTLQRP